MAAIPHMWIDHRGGPCECNNASCCIRTPLWHACVMAAENLSSVHRALDVLPADQVAALLTTENGAPLPGTDAAPRDVPAVLERLRAERARGFALAAEEMEPGLTAVAVPVHDHRGDVVAAVNVSAPVFRLP